MAHRTRYSPFRRRRALNNLLFSLLTFATSTFSPASQNLNSPELLAERCQATLPGEATLYREDFKWFYSLPEMNARFEEVYQSERRLGQRAYFDRDAGGLKLPYHANRGGDILVPLSFVQSIKRHVEEALRLEYIDAVFFPDMGHSHFLVNQEKYKNTYSKFPISEMARLYEAYFQDKELKVVYHTAEQLQMLDDSNNLLPDRRLQWRFFSRNLVGDNRGEGRLELLQNSSHRSNTLHGAPGYHWWGGGFNLSANAKGCIAYVHNGVVKYFDISLYDLEPRSGTGGGDYF
jgi:hypothetical protein